MRRLRHAKIIATLGPASSKPDRIEALFKAGADVFRLNFSHGTHESHKQLIASIRETEERLGRPIAIMADMQGPKFRVGVFAYDSVQLVKGQTFVLDRNPVPGDEQRVYLPHEEVFAAARPGIELLLCDGKIRLKVLDVSPEAIKTEVTVPGILASRQGINVPGVRIPVSALTPKDREDLEFALKMGADWIALSFVQHPDDILQARAIVKEQAKIIVKLEKPMAIEHLDNIVELSDALIVARGDLGVEMLPEDVPVLQRQIIRTCRYRAKPVVVATQMLESMITNPTPTRAEVSDVANAIYEGVDAVMLSGESASGKFPVEAVAMMQRIISRVEQDPLYREEAEHTRAIVSGTITDSIAAAVREVAEKVKVSAIVSLTQSGLTALNTAHERPHSPIIALTPFVRTARYLPLVWGVHPCLSPIIDSVDQMIEAAKHAVTESGFAKKDDLIVVTAGVPCTRTGATNSLRIETV